MRQLFAQLTWQTTDTMAFRALVIYSGRASAARLGDCGDELNGICCEVMPANTLVYLGHYETSFRKLHADQDHYWTKPQTEDGHPGNPVDPIPEKFQGGTHFGFMQTADGFIFVRINRLVLPTPVLFIGERHGPNAPGPSSSTKIGPEAALNILADVIVANPGFRDELIRLVARHGSQQAL